MTKRFICILIALALVSCAEVPLEPVKHDRGTKGRLLFYIHTDQKNVPDLEFVISGMEVLGTGGVWSSVMDETVKVSSLEVEKGQRYIKEAMVPPGNYKSLRITVSAASIKRDNGRANLSLPGPDGQLVLPMKIELLERQSLVVNIAWKPVDSIRKRVSFEPSLKVEPSLPPPRDLLLYVSNSGDDYLSIIDKERERVVGALTVGRAPMGIAVNDTHDTVYVANSGDSTISVVDATDFHVRELIGLSAGYSPVDIVFLPGSEPGLFGKLYVLGKSSSEITVISTDGNEEINSIPVGFSPVHMAIDTGRGEIYVVDAISRDISVISALTDTVVSTIKLGSTPAGIAVGDGALYVFMETVSAITVVSPSTREVVDFLPVFTPPARGMAWFDGRFVVLSRTSDKVLFFDDSMTSYTEIEAGPGPIDAEKDELRNRLYVVAHGGDTLVVIDPVLEVVVARLRVGRKPYGVVSVED